MFACRGSFALGLEDFGFTFSLGITLVAPKRSHGVADEVKDLAARPSSSSVGSPDGLIHPARGAHGGGGIAVAAVRVHAVVLRAQAGVHQVVPRRGAGAGRQHAGGRALAPRHHGELVGARGRPVVQVVGRGVGLEGPTLVLRGAGVGRRQVGVVEAGGGGHAGHADAPDARGRGRGRVGEGCGHGAGVMHPRVGESRLRQRRQRREGALELPRVREGAQL